MKGLLLKDWYMVKKYCRAYLLITVVFIAVSLFSNDNMFFVFYPCLLCGMIPVNLLGYDERSRWMQYSGTLPYTRTQIVCGKYIIGLRAQFAILVVTGIAQAAKMIVAGNFVFGDFAVLMLLMLIVSTLTSSICLPFVFNRHCHSLPTVSGYSLYLYTIIPRRRCQPPTAASCRLHRK